MRTVLKTSWLLALGMFVYLSLFVTRIAKAVDVNPDYVNSTGGCISDVEVILEGTLTVTDHMDGHDDEAHFTSFDWWNPSNTYLVWDDVTGGDCTEHPGWIADGEEFHVGWTTEPDTDYTSVLTAYGTVPDEEGEHVKAGDFAIVNVHGRFAGFIFLLTVRNNILPARVMYVNNFRYQLVLTPYTLSNLNGRVLDGLLTPISGQGTLAFNAELSIEIPSGIEGRQEAQSLPHVVIAFDVKEQGSSYLPTTMYLQFHPSTGVGGVAIPVDKFGLLTPYISLASTIVVATVATTIYVKCVKRRRGKNDETTPKHKN